MRDFGPPAKRIVDLFLTVPALVASLPVQAGVAVVIAAKLGRPVLFRQMRPGYQGEPFELVKFRTMRPVDAARGWVSDSSRMTSVGRILRATSLDELPTLWNVVRGQMSLVGPRPLLMKYLDLYNSEQARRHDVRPGLTGLAQVSGRNALSWEEKLRLDVHYVDHHSLFLDLRIIMDTVAAVLRRDGISATDSDTMPEFRGQRTS